MSAHFRCQSGGEVDCQFMRWAIHGMKFGTRGDGQYSCPISSWSMALAAHLLYTREFSGSR